MEILLQVKFAYASKSHYKNKILILLWKCEISAFLKYNLIKQSLERGGEGFITYLLMWELQSLRLDFFFPEGFMCLK